MKTTHTFGIQFILRQGKRDKNIGIIYARITVDTKRTEISVKNRFQLRTGIVVVELQKVQVLKLKNSTVIWNR